MNGAEALIQSLARGGIRTIFTNPGTSELHFVQALERIPEIRSILCLFEGVVTGAADGYARMSGRPAATLLHLGPGLANGLASIHNGSRAATRMINVVGEHATYHKAADAPLTADIAAIGGQYSSWIGTVGETVSLGDGAREAIAAATASDGGIATLILPTDIAWSDGAEPIEPAPRASPRPVDESVVEACAALLGEPGTTGILLGNGLGQGETLEAAGALAAAAGATLYVPFGFSRLQRGVGRPVVERIPYPLEQALAALKHLDRMILVGAKAPVAFFAYKGMPSRLLPPDCTAMSLSKPGEDHAAAMNALSRRLGPKPSARQAAHRPARQSGPITLQGLADAIASVLPENCIVADESLTSGRGMMAASAGAPPHDWLPNPGGSIGAGLPLALGAAIACPDRQVLCLQADGSAMYTVQALWTMAREGLKITIALFANRSYAILKGEMAKLAPGPLGNRADAMLSLDRPAIDWVSLAGSLGVAAERVESLEAFTDALERGFAAPGPRLIEVAL